MFSEPQYFCPTLGYFQLLPKTCILVLCPDNCFAISFSALDFVAHTLQFWTLQSNFACPFGCFVSPKLSPKASKALPDGKQSMELHTGRDKISCFRMPKIIPARGLCALKGDRNGSFVYFSFNPPVPVVIRCHRLQTETPHNWCGRFFVHFSVALAVFEYLKRFVFRLVVFVLHFWLAMFVCEAA